MAWIYVALAVLALLALVRVSDAVYALQRTIIAASDLHLERMQDVESTLERITTALFDTADAIGRMAPKQDKASMWP